ncbi:spindle pole body protein [Laccaria bicolor S238N-H82]|uniref:Spindle pole body protein n=1 Tax=Laccaria bicolor (strain S238N-H82 / ATCC MYA-4686) TaxID=486041 RepID=B0CRQ9_LACBS|nr:spindle pole body protein [Laccaria bicolor S238N-H82]EDR15242.1 spindle pole body protein [Laccaria bicolor S238N-H82]|eukprot:XP_001873450.1 spindle pole body protein [Laccaria bicolor S238N-H82]
MVDQTLKRDGAEHLQGNAVRPTKKQRISGDASENDTEMPADSEEEEEDMPIERAEESRASDLYLDTINRAILDFDFEKVCSVSLSNINIYGCLVCGKYFQGRGRKSYAYAHSIHDDHHVFINLETTKVYVLPDGYLVSDPSLEDISYVLAPSFTPSSIAHLSSNTHILKPSYDLTNKPYLPGYVGLNNIKRNDHMNVIIHSLLHIPPLRDSLLLSRYRGKESELLKRFAGLAKKVWNPRLFKSQVSPHEFLQEVNRASGGKFRLEQQGDPAEFLGWLLNRLHKDLGGTKKKCSSTIFSTFQGELRLETQQVLVRPDVGENDKPRFDIDRDIKTSVSPFLFLAVDLPPPPLFQDAIEKNIIPQVGIHSVLSKYDGRTTQESAGHLRRYKCQRLPPYIILHYKRFTKNAFVEEKNPTIVNFPLRGVDFREYVDAPSTNETTLYDLIANVTHESVAGTTRDKENTVWKAHLRAAGGGGDNEKWFMIQDLIVEETRKEMIFLGETVLQIWERRTTISSNGQMA